MEKLKLDRIPEEWRVELARLKWLLLFVPVLLLLLLANIFPGAVESLYSRGIFLLLNNIWNYLFGFFPVSIAEWLLYIVLIGVPASLLVMLVLALVKRVKWTKLARLFITYLIVFCILFNAFYVLWGFNYHRQPISQLLELDVHERPVEELEALCYSLAGTAKTLRGNTEEDDAGVFRLTAGVDGSLAAIPGAYKALGVAIPMVSRTIPVPKQVINGQGMSQLGISGVYVPFTAEANVNVHQPDLLIASSAAHEAAHSIGFARENECNFLAYLACLCVEDLSIQYSGVMLALITSGNALHDADPDSYAQLRSTYSDAMERDLAHYNAYWARYDGPIAEGMDRINDGYLKFNSQQSGVKSYGEMVDLLLAWFYKEVPKAAE